MWVKTYRAWRYGKSSSGIAKSNWSIGIFRRTTCRTLICSAIFLRSLPDSYGTLITALEPRPEEDLTTELVKGKLLKEFKKSQKYFPYAKWATIKSPKDDQDWSQIKDTSSLLFLQKAKPHKGKSAENTLSGKGETQITWSKHWRKMWRRKKWKTILRLILVLRHNYGMDINHIWHSLLIKAPHHICIARRISSKLSITNIKLTYYRCKADIFMADGQKIPTTGIVDIFNCR